MNTKGPKSIANAFNDCITRHDLDGLAALMTDNHTFIDRKGNISRTKKSMIESWKKFFDLFPRYKNIFTRVESRDGLVIMLGYAYWSEEQPHDSVIWTATIADNLVSEWRIFEDTDANRVFLHLPADQSKP